MTQQQFLKLCSPNTSSNSCYSAIFDRNEREATDFISFLWDKKMMITKGALHTEANGNDFVIAYTEDKDGNFHKTFFVTCPADLVGTVLAYTMQVTDVHCDRNLFCALGDNGILVCSAIVKDVNVMDIHGLKPALEAKDACGIIRLITDGNVGGQLIAELVLASIRGS